MSMNRRQLLQALGSAAALPFLPSIARAQTAAPFPKFYVHFCTDHGAVWAEHMYPAAANPTTQMYGGRPIRQQPLALGVSNGIASLSPVLSGPSNVFTAKLASKMNVIQGLDWPLYLGHHTGGHMGNIARNDGNGGTTGDGAIVGQNPRPTIDQLMAWSSGFYPDLSGIRERTLVMGSRISYMYADPATRTGAIQEVTGDEDSNDWYDRVFPTGTMSGTMTARPPVVNRVLQSYQRLHDSTRRMSADDKIRLEQHMQRLDEVQRRLSVNAPAQCVIPARPAQSNSQLYGGPYIGDFDVNPAKHSGWYEMLNDVLVAAFSCQLSRIAVVKSMPDFSNYVGDWHQDIAHKANLLTGSAQDTLYAANQLFFSTVFLDLASKLDAMPDGIGGTLLDHCLLVWTQESGNMTHDTFSVPVITAGGAGGYFSTGNYVDYRNTALNVYPSNTKPEYPGLLMHQWLGMTLRAMGVPHAEWAEPDHAGYGYKYANLNWSPLTTAQAYPDSLWSTTGDELPWLKA
jgi:hypothetical protein